jgi:hypothetical protein
MDAEPDAAPACDGGDPGFLGFTPSNISLAGVDLCGLGAADITANCILDTTDKIQDCTTANVRQIVIDQGPNAPKLAVWLAKSWTIEANATVTVSPTRAVALLALDKIQIDGTITAAVQNSGPSAGGFSDNTAMANTKGTGPGAGGAGSAKNAAGGGGYCGVGGTGAALAGGTAAMGGAMYGNATLIPLIGGSSGGAGDGAPFPGSGGGAIQLVAKNSVTVGALGVVTVGGGGGVSGGAAPGQEANGGGSGGAILIESATVTINGTLAANGGGGGGQADGTDATPNATAAAGGGTLGGSGSAAGTAAGSPGKAGAAVAGAGGGGAGRIRINTASGMAAGAGTHSPSAASGCATQGKVMP